MTFSPEIATADHRADEADSERQLVFTSSQAASYLGVSLATIRRWADAGYVSCYRTPGSQRRFSRRQLDEFIASLQSDGGEGQRAA
jgi:excisionase family DNA binding protein